MNNVDISYLMNKHLNFRFGHMIVPVGLTNAHHEPLNFFGVYRPEEKQKIIQALNSKNNMN